jgi:hypothetical protein
MISNREDKGPFERVVMHSLEGEQEGRDGEKSTIRRFPWQQVRHSHATSLGNGNRLLQADNETDLRHKTTY